MKRRKTASVLSTFVIASQMLVSVSFGQVKTTFENAPNLPKSERKNNNQSKYLLDIAQLIKNGELNLSGDDVERETLKLETALNASTGKGAILIDESGARSALIVENLAARLDSGNVAQNLRGKEIVQLNLGGILTDFISTDDVEKRIQEALRDVESSKGKKILYVQDVSAFTQNNPLFGEIIAKNIRESLAVAKIRVISSTTLENYKEQIAADTLIKNRFQKIDLSSAESDADNFAGDKLSPDLRELVASGDLDKTVRVILQSDDIKNSQLRELLAQNGVKIEAEAANLNMLVVELPVRVAEAVSEIRGAKHLSLDKEVKTFGHIDTTTGVLAAKTQTGNSTLDGRGIGVAVMDSAIFDNHHTFIGADGNKRIVEHKEFVTGGGEDKFGHGTHVAAIAAGRGGKPGDIASTAALKNYQGVAPEAKIVAVRVLDNEGKGTTAKLIEAINWVYINRTKYNIRVVNMSLGTPAVESYTTDPLCVAVRKLTAAGIVVVAAAGNNGKNALGQKIYGAIHSPGNDPTVITVGASNTFGTDSRSDDAISTLR